MLLGTVEHFYPRLHLCRRNPWPHLKAASCDTGSPVRLHELGSLPRCAHYVHARRHIPAERAEVVDGEFLNAAEGLDLFIDGSVGHPGALSRAWTVAHAGGAAAGAAAKHFALDDHDDARHVRGGWGILLGYVRQALAGRSRALCWQDFRESVPRQRN